MNVNPTSMLKRRRLFILTALFFFLASTSFASNGYFSTGFGTQYKGLAGAGVALSLSTLAAATNPAAMVFTGNRYDVAIAAFNPNREFNIIGNPSGFQGTFGLTPGSVTSDTKLFIIPSLGANWMLDDESSIGASVYGNGGMNTDYSKSVFYGSSPTGVDLSQLFLGLTYARKITAEHVVGVTALLAYQRFQAQGLQAFAGFSSNPLKLTDNGHVNSFGVGARIGYLGEFGKYFSVGSSYQTKAAMGKLDNYAGLFAQQGGFDIPANWTAGVAIKPTDQFAVAVDVQQILYSGVKSVNNPFNPANFQRGILLGHDNGSGFGWEDMTVVKIGLQLEGGEGWTWRGGFSTGKQPIPSGEVLFNILAPGVIEQHATFGFSKKTGDHQSVNVSITHAFSKTVSGPNPLEVPGRQTIELKMNQWEFEVGFSF